MNSVYLHLPLGFWRKYETTVLQKVLLSFLLKDAAWAALLSPVHFYPTQPVSWVITHTDCLPPSSQELHGWNLHYMQFTSFYPFLIKWIIPPRVNIGLKFLVLCHYFIESAPSEERYDSGSVRSIKPLSGNKLAIQSFSLNIWDFCLFHRWELFADLAGCSSL